MPLMQCPLFVRVGSCNFFQGSRDDLPTPHEVRSGIFNVHQPLRTDRSSGFKVHSRDRGNKANGVKCIWPNNVFKGLA